MTRKELIEELTCGVSTLTPWAESLITKFEETKYQQGSVDAIEEFVSEIKKHNYLLCDKGINSTDYGMFTCGLEQIANELKEQKNKYKEVKVIERGWAGHLIVANDCRFRRNTLLEYKDRKWIVSTVGAWVLDNKFSPIGFNRFYETMALVGVERDGYIEADVTKPIAFESEWGLCGETWQDILERYPCPDNHANDMHEKVVSELMQKITMEVDNAECN